MTQKRVRAIREAMGLTQAEFAKRLRVSRNTVARMEVGLQVITPVMALLLSYVAREAGVDAASHTGTGRRITAPKKAGCASAGHSTGKGRRKKNSV
jgi:transcriptional regulator with XRE-family HTH domain